MALLIPLDEMNGFWIPARSAGVEVAWPPATAHGAIPVGSPPVAQRKLLTMVSSICARMIQYAISARVTFAVGLNKGQFKVPGPGLVVVPGGGGVRIGG